MAINRGEAMNRNEAVSIVRLPRATAMLLALCVAGACHGSAKAKPEPDGDADPVNVGYGTQPRSQSNAAVGTVDAEANGEQAITTWEQLIVGRVAGLQVIRGASGLVLRVRGPSTISGDADPLVIVNGTQLSGSANLLYSVNPQDVSRIEVLKDAGSTAIYGSRGANGVVLVTLKKSGQ
jgi:TonB-dependent starch-binding outer membrane protein SusC